jgi:hypothetical protein
MTEELRYVWLTAFTAALLSLVLSGPAATQGTAVSETSITVAGEDTLTVGDATPLYIRGTGLNDHAFRMVRLGDSVLVNDENRGLTLTILDAVTHAHVSSVNFDTWDAPSQSNLLAGALAALTDGQIGILTSCDAFELNVTAPLRAEARKLGLFKLAGIAAEGPEASWRHPYAAIFYASGGDNYKAEEVLQSNDLTAPHAIIATWLIGDGFVGQAVTPADYLRCAGARGLPGPRFTDCGDGTIVDNHTGLFWLKDASCAALGPNGDGTGSWQEALDAAAALGDGTCGLSDGSAAGDWRLARMKDYCTFWETVLPSTCPAWAKSESLVNTRFTSPALSNAEGGAIWSEGDAFVGVQQVYWSSEEYDADGAWALGLNNGFGGWMFKSVSEGYYIWPVRGAL